MSNKNENFDDEFESVKGPSNVWNPTKDEEGDPRTEATDSDFITGYYVDRKDGVGEHDSTIIVLEKKDGEKVSVWATKMLKDEIEKVRLGQFIKIQWLGKKLTKAGSLKPEKKRTSTDSYHAWDVLVSKNTPPKGMEAEAHLAKTSTPAATGQATQNQIVAPKVDDDSDLPF